MLDLKTARKVKEVIKKKDVERLLPEITLLDVMSMERIAHTNNGPYIYALQNGNVTILVWITSSISEEELSVWKVKFVYW